MGDILFCLMLYACFILLLLYGCRYEPVNGKQDMLCRLNSLRGFFALEIIVGHVVRYENTLLYPMGKGMIISVAFFFFVSAYGMSYSAERKISYFKGFLKKKCGYLFMLAVLAYAFRLMVNLILPISLEEFQLIGIRDVVACFISSTNWYIWELLFFYILFYLVYKVGRTNVRIAAVTGMSVLLMHLSYYYLYEGFYASTLAFPLGMLVCVYFDNIIAFIRTICGKILMATLSAVGLSSLVVKGGRTVCSVWCI